MFRTSLEQELEAATEPRSFAHQRQRHFSVDYGLWIKRDTTVAGDPIIPSADLPDGDWISDSFLAMVRDEGLRTCDETAYQHPPQDSHAVSDHALVDYLEKCEDSLFGPICDRIFRDPGLDNYTKIHKILSDQIIGNPVNRKSVTPHSFAEKCSKLALKEIPLTFILPAFPFKEQNSFRSHIDASSPDFGEVALLCRLHALAMAINQLYHNDVRWVIVTDGTAYEGIFGITRGSAAIYMQHLRAARNALNLTSTIHFVDLMTLVSSYNRVAANLGPSFEEIATVIRSVLHGTKDDRICAALIALAEGMKWNRGWEDLLPSIGRERMWELLRKPIGSDEGANDRDMEVIQSTSIGMAVAYASFNLTMRWSRLMDNFFPSAIRATSHAKAGQVAVPRLGSVSPWNGVGLASLDRSGRPEFSSHPLYQITCSEMTNITRVGGIPAGVATWDFLTKYRI